MNKNCAVIIGSMRAPGQKTVSLISRAYSFVQQCYGGDGADGGLGRAVRTATIVAELGLGKRAVTTALLEHPFATGLADGREIEREFGKEILATLKKIKNLSAVPYREKKSYIENQIKFFLAGAEDLRVLIVKLAKRLDELRHAETGAADEVHRLAKEAMDLYVPLAERLGLVHVKTELETLAFGIVNPKAHAYIAGYLRRKEAAEKKRIERFKKLLLKALAKRGIAVIETSFRLKSIPSIWRKFKEKGSLERVYDIRALRLTVGTAKDCYDALAAANEHWRFLPNRVKDYIAFPKPDGYRSLHATLLVGRRAVVEVQLRTPAMDRRAAQTALSHALYKPRDKNLVHRWFGVFFPPPKRAAGKYGEKPAKNVPDWIKRLVDVNAYVAGETPRSAPRKKFFEKRMFVFGAGGEVADLPKGATVIDFAFAVEPETGLRLCGARVNGKFTGIATGLANGDVVKLETRKNASPRRRWLKYAATPLAREKIRRAIHSASA